MVVAPDVDPRWGADVSLLIARELSAKGRKILLADASFERPVLHEAAGVANGEGISDVLLYGVSLRHVSEPIGGGVVLAPTGTPAGDIQELLGHPNWETLIRGFDEAGATILVHLPSETPGAQAFLDGADALIVLAADQEEGISVVPEASHRVLAVMGPGAGVVEEPDVVEDMEPVEEMEPDSEAETEDGGGADLEVDAEAAPAASDGGEASPTKELAEVDSKQPEEASDSFSVSGLAGSQYEAAGGVAEVPLEADDEDPASTDDHLDADVYVGAAIDVDEQEMAEAADAGPLDGFETGAGFESEDAPATDDLDVAGQALEIEATGIIDEEVPVVEEVADAAAAAALESSDEPEVGTTAADSVPEGSGPDMVPTLTLEEGDVGAEEDTAEARAKRRFMGLEELERRRSRKAIYRQLMTAFLTVGLVGGGGYAVAYYGFVNIPGITPAERVRSLVPPPVELPGPLPETPVMRHVLFVDSWRDRDTPISTAVALQGRLPQLLFFVTPIVTDGSRQYGLFVGPAFSSLEANALKAPLAEVLDRLNPDDWLVQPAPYAFFFGEYGTVDEAYARVKELSLSSVSTYVLEVSYAAEAPTAFRVYGGAFSDEFQATEMGRVMDENDVSGAPLTERRGRVP